MELIPNVGLGPLRFGMNPAQVRSLVPETETYEEWMGGNLNDSILYRGLILGFDAHDSLGPLARGQFTDIRLNRREDAVIWGKTLCAWTKEAVTHHLEQNRIGFDVSEYGEIFVPALSLSLSFDDSSCLEYVEMWRAGDRAEQIVGRERRERVSQLDSSGDA